MDGCYSVCFGNQSVGKVQVLRQGLYYRFICRCQLSSEILCRLQVSCGGKTESLGILVPMDGGFGLDTKIPTKRLGQGSMEFCLCPKTELPRGQFVPISPEEPFAYIAKLKKSYLVWQEGQAGILLEEG